MNRTANGWRAALVASLVQLGIFASPAEARSWKEVRGWQAVPARPTGQEGPAGDWECRFKALVGQAGENGTHAAGKRFSTFFFECRCRLGPVGEQAHRETYAFSSPDPWDPGPLELRPDRTFVLHPDRKNPEKAIVLGTYSVVQERVLGREWADVTLLEFDPDVRIDYRLTGRYEERREQVPGTFGLATQIVVRWVPLKSELLVTTDGKTHSLPGSGERSEACITHSDCFKYLDLNLAP